MTPALLRKRNRNALITLLAGKVCGLVGIGVSWAGFRTFGAGLLIVAGALVVTAVVLCLQVMSKQADEEDAER